MKKILMAGLLIASSAFAKGAMSPQTHHCEVNGAEVSKTHKECTKAGGKWAKGAPATATPAPATPPATK